MKKTLVSKTICLLMAALFALVVAIPATAASGYSTKITEAAPVEIAPLDDKPPRPYFPE